MILSQYSVKSLPLLKWPGEKRRILNHLLPLVPQSFGTYYEPFLGGGALFFAIQPDTAVLSDNEPELINCYLQVRDHADELIEHLSTCRNTEEYYCQVRSAVPECDVAKAARLIYLTTLSFNGIHRLNRKGEFNVPYGRRTHLEPCDPLKIRAASSVLSSVSVYCADFEATVSGARKGDVVYLDPPYTVVHGNNGFLRYNAKIFSWDDQTRLAHLAKRLADRGCRVLVSNANHPSILSLYADYKSETFERGSQIAASSQFHRQVAESIFYNEV